VRVDGVRAKKLIVAFHFQFSNQAGWECDACRKSGLEARRRCGWLPDLPPSQKRVVWARKGAATESCPKSFITAESLAWVERFIVWKRLGFSEPREPSARDAEAFVVLEQEWATEMEAAKARGRDH
jgi:hypothetical protein